MMMTRQDRQKDNWMEWMHWLLNEYKQKLFIEFLDKLDRWNQLWKLYIQIFHRQIDNEYVVDDWNCLYIYIVDYVYLCWCKYCIMNLKDSFFFRFMSYYVWMTVGSILNMLYCIVQAVYVLRFLLVNSKSCLWLWLAHI